MLTYAMTPNEKCNSRDILRFKEIQTEERRLQGSGSLRPRQRGQIANVPFPGSYYRMESAGFQLARVTLGRKKPLGSLCGNLEILMGRDPGVVKRLRHVPLPSLNGTRPPTQALSGICFLSVPESLSSTLSLFLLSLKTA